MTSSSPGDAYRLTFKHQPPLLLAWVSGGEDTRLEVTFDYWMRIAAEVRAIGASQLLVVDEMQGEVMTNDDLERFFTGIRGHGLEGVRIAYVEGRPDQMQRIEFVEQMALERGYSIRVFGNERDAVFWLRHGLQ